MTIGAYVQLVVHARYAARNKAAKPAYHSYAHQNEQANCQWTRRLFNQSKICAITLQAGHF